MIPYKYLRDGRCSFGKHCCYKHDDGKYSSKEEKMREEMHTKFCKFENQERGCKFGPERCRCKHKRVKKSIKDEKRTKRRTERRTTMNMKIQKKNMMKQKMQIFYGDGREFNNARKLANTLGVGEDANKDSKKQHKVKKVRRGGKRIKNKMKKFKVLYMNLRGLKSKKKSIQEIIEEEKPTLIAFVETLLEEKEEIKLEGYKVLMPDEKG